MAICAHELALADLIQDRSFAVAPAEQILDVVELVGAPKVIPAHHLRAGLHAPRIVVR